MNMHRTGRSPLFHQLKRTFRAAHLQNINMGSNPAGPTRRQFMSGLGIGVGAALLSAYARPARGSLPSGPRVAVVGAGIAGLNATCLLANAGFDFTLYEASKHVGGRIQT